MDLISIREASKEKGMSVQAIYEAIRVGKIKAIKQNVLKVSPTDIDHYIKNKYSRENFQFEGKKIFDNSKGWHSISQTAKILGCPAQQIYHAIRMGAIKAYKVGHWHMRIKYKDIVKYQTLIPIRNKKRNRKNRQVA